MEGLKNVCSKKRNSQKVLISKFFKREGLKNVCSKMKLKKSLYQNLSTQKVSRMYAQKNETLKKY